jgi:hypothetical protein
MQYMRISSNFNIRDNYKTLFHGHFLHLFLNSMMTANREKFWNSTAYEMFIYLLPMTIFM